MQTFEPAGEPNCSARVEAEIPAASNDNEVTTGKGIKMGTTWSKWQREINQRCYFLLLLESWQGHAWRHWQKFTFEKSHCNYLSNGIVELPFKGRAASPLGVRSHISWWLLIIIMAVTPLCICLVLWLLRCIFRHYIMEKQCGQVEEARDSVWKTWISIPTLLCKLR